MINVNKIWDKVPCILKKMPSPGILLVSGKDNKKKNVMTIGWVQFGCVWREAVCNILVRPSRYTFKLLQEHDEFTINVMPDTYNKEIAFCGANSGSFCDKFKETDLQIINSSMVSTVSIKNAEIILECKILHKTNVNPENLNDLILARYYSSEDYHQIITASILNIKST